MVIKSTQNKMLPLFFVFFLVSVRVIVWVAGAAEIKDIG